MSQFRCRQIDKYDGQYIYSGNKVVYELGNYLGGGASGSVYQATDVSDAEEKSVAVKILNPLGYKNAVVGQINKCSVAVKGQPLSLDQIHGKAPFSIDNVWWLIHPTSKELFAAFEDPHRAQLRELPLPKCVEIWGFNPLRMNQLSKQELEKFNVSSTIINIGGTSVRIPLVSPKYIKFLRSRQVVCREMSNMIRIGEHPNIIDLYEVLELIQDTKTTLFLVLELVNGGELIERMKTGGNNYSEDFARKYFEQLLSGIQYCHQKGELTYLIFKCQSLTDYLKGIVHRDLKPENLLLSDATDSAILKIADFGLSAVIFATESFSIADKEKETNQRILSSRTGIVSSSNFRNKATISQPLQEETTYYESDKTSATKSGFGTPSKSAVDSEQSNYPSIISPNELRRLRSVVGSPHYIAPEIASNDPSGYDGRKVDMWSAGIILYSLLTGALPFGSDIGTCPRFKRYKSWLINDHSPAQKEAKEIAVPSWFLPGHISMGAGSLLVQLLHHDPAIRLSAAEALKHPWCLGLDQLRNLRIADEDQGEIDERNKGILTAEMDEARASRKKSNTPPLTRSNTNGSGSSNNAKGSTRGRSPASKCSPPPHHKKLSPENSISSTQTSLVLDISSVGENFNTSPSEDR